MNQMNKRKKLTPIKAIRAKCLDCCCGSWKEVRLCPADDCPIWPYRFGKRPETVGIVDKSAIPAENSIDSY